MAGPWPIRDLLAFPLAFNFVDGVPVMPWVGSFICAAAYAMVLGSLALATYSLREWGRRRKYGILVGFLALAGFSVNAGLVYAITYHYFGYMLPYVGSLLWFSFASIAFWSALAGNRGMQPFEAVERGNL